MHLLEPDASESLLYWFMDSTTARKSETNFDMIQTSSRIESSLPSRISEHVTRGNRFSAPQRVFSKIGSPCELNDRVHERQAYASATDYSSRKNAPLKLEVAHRNSEDRRVKISARSPSRDTQTSRVAFNSANENVSSIRCGGVPNNDSVPATGNSSRKPHLNGFINGLITGKNSKEVNRERHDPENKKVLEKFDGKSRSSLEKQSLRNMNGNNNRHVPANSVKHANSKIIISSHTQSTKLQHASESAKYSHKNKGGDDGELYYRYDSKEQTEEEALNGSDILKKMYASFGPNEETVNDHGGALLPKSNAFSSINKPPQISSTSELPSESAPVKKRKYNSEYHNGYSITATTCKDTAGPVSNKKSFPVQPAPSNTSESQHKPSKISKPSLSETISRKVSPASSVPRPVERKEAHVAHSKRYQNEKCIEAASAEANILLGNKSTDRRTSQSSSGQRASSHSKSSQAQSEADIVNSPERKYPKNGEMPKIKSPDHSIDALLSNKRSGDKARECIGKSFGSGCTKLEENDCLPKTHRSPVGQDESLPISLSPNQQSGHCGSRNEQSDLPNLYDINRRRSKQSPAKDEKYNLNESDEEERRASYNAKSREIFSRERELIENSLRQNKLPFGMRTEAPAYQNPYMLNPNTLAALQTSLLSTNAQNALTDPSMMLKSASIVAAASANPFAMGLNNYFANPYLLRGLIGNGLPGAAYTQAMAQGFLTHPQSIIPFLNTMPGSHPAFPASTPVMYGGLPLPDSSPITAAIAASMRQSSSACYPNNSFPYPFIPQPINHQASALRSNEADALNTVKQSSPDKADSSKYSPGTERHNSDFSDSTNKCVSELKRDRVGDLDCADAPPRFHKKDDPRRADLPSAFSAHPLPSRQSRNSLKDNKMKNAKQASSPTNSPLFGGIHNKKLKRKSSSQSVPADRLTLPRKKLCQPGNSDVKFSKQPGNLPPELVLKSLDSSKADHAQLDITTASRGHMTSEKSSSRPSSYKNLTRERRLVANARERTRVHTISSAFEELRQQIPSYSCNQKLSKLAILRIACSYIQSLSVLSGRNTEDTFTESVDQCTRVLQAESRARSRRKSNKAQIEWEVANYEKLPTFGSEVRAKGETTRQSHETTSSVGKELTLKSPPQEGFTQVHDESTNRRADEQSRSESPFPRDVKPLQAARLEDSNRYSDQSQRKPLADKLLSTVDSLDPRTVHTERLHVNDPKDVNLGLNHATELTRDSNTRGDTWRANISKKPPSEISDNENEHEKGASEPAFYEPTATSYNSHSAEYTVVEDHQGELINVED